jgi:AraC-like DNA-binding protein
MQLSAQTSPGPLKHVLDDTPESREIWRQTTARFYGLKCEYAPGRSVCSTSASWNLGQLDLLQVAIANQFLSTLAPGDPHWPGDGYLYLKLVREGTMMIEQGGQARVFQSGQLILLDPKRPYRQSFNETTQLIALRIPKVMLRERGFRHDLRGLHAPDAAAPDVHAVSDLILSMADQAGATSARMRRRQGEQLLDLIDIVLDDPSVLMRARSGDATLFRAKRFIAQNLRNADLTATLIASAVSASEAHLHRLFKSEGISLMRYVWMRRLELAARLLKECNESRIQIQEIAYRCGFSTPAHFSRAFKDHYGVSPRDATMAELTGEHSDV